MDIAELLNSSPYSLSKNEKREVLDSFLTQLTRHHYNNCPAYSKMMDGIGYNYTKEYNYTELPFLPVRLFKMLDLLSVGKEEIVKTITSSGTSGQAVSRIYLDRDTSANQTKVLTKIVSSFIGKQRVPMIIIDTDAILKNRNLFSARIFSYFQTLKNLKCLHHALNEEMELNTELIQNFLESHKNERIFLFGFTFMIWQHFYKQLIEKGIKLDLSNAVLIHGGGWKKLVSESVSSLDFKEKLHEVCGISHVHDYYGMVEQTGSIYMECECGHLHAPVYSDVIIRHASDFSKAGIGEKGIIQVVSILPFSYPGHSLLTEDEGILLGEDDCSCGRLGKYFKVVGRLKNAEIRGCSDTYAEKF